MNKAIITKFIVVAILLAGCKSTARKVVFVRGEGKASVFAKIYSTKNVGSHLAHLITMREVDGSCSIYKSWLVTVPDIEHPVFVFRNDGLANIVADIPDADMQPNPLIYAEQILKKATADTANNWSAELQKHKPHYDWGLLIAALPVIVLSGDGKLVLDDENVNRSHKAQRSEDALLGMPKKIVELQYGCPFAKDEYDFYYYTELNPYDEPVIPITVLVKYDDDENVSAMASYRLGQWQLYFTKVRDIKVKRHVYK